MKPAALSQDIVQTVFVVDDDDAVRDSVSILLKTMGLQVEDYPSAAAFLEGTNAEDGGVNGCLVLDIRMPHMSGLELQHHLTAAGSRLPIIFITGHGDIPMAVQAMRDGALDFIRKPFRDQELLDRVHAALAVDAESTAATEHRDQIAHRATLLTPRELEIFERVAAGQANKVVAIELGISERTVEIHRSQVMHKMEARNLAQLVRMKIELERD